ncbi:TadE/TadG family type IV pilus assembly protein [Nocardioides cheoyonin]|uniref:TadE/TadG family type IV pilus assembly protein n=1 Tax=Nocardioides cheoyonin TaxID=3156615 RepID=UPI0032B456D5
MARRTQRGAAVVDFVLVMVVLLPLVLGVMQLALVLYVRNTSRRRPPRARGTPRPSATGRPTAPPVRGPRSRACSPGGTPSA